MEEGKFICDDCALNGFLFNGTHRKMHTVVRVSDGDEGEGPSTEEQLRLVKNELAKMRQDFEEVKASLREVAEEVRRSFREVAQSHAEMRQEAEEVRRSFREVARTHAETRRDFEEVKRFMEVVRVVVETR